MPRRGGPLDFIPAKHFVKEYHEWCVLARLTHHPEAYSKTWRFRFTSSRLQLPQTTLSPGVADSLPHSRCRSSGTTFPPVPNDNSYRSA